MSTDRRGDVRIVVAELAAFAAACLLFAIAALFAAPASADEPAQPAAAASSEVTPSLEPPIDELRKLVGKTAEVTFTVMTVGGRSSLFLNSQKDWQAPDCFTAMLVPAAQDELKKLGTDAPFDDLIGRRVRCRGKVELYQGRVQIVVRDFAKQFELLVPETAADAPAAERPETASTAKETPIAASSATEPSADLSSVPSSPDTPYVHPSVEELRAAVGKECDVMFRVLNAGGRTHVYINSQKDYRRSDCFTAQVGPAAVDGLATLGLNDPRTELIGKLVECRGTLQLDNDRVNIVVTDVKTQLHIVDEPAQKSTEESQPVEEPPAAP